MASITIRQLDDAVKEKLRLRAKQNQRSLEAEARLALKAWVTDVKSGGASFERVEMSMRCVDLQISDDVLKS